jgi:hypothetical protein
MKKVSYRIFFHNIQIKKNKKIVMGLGGATLLQGPKKIAR